MFGTITKTILSLLTFMLILMPTIIGIIGMVVFTKISFSKKNFSDFPNSQQGFAKTHVVLYWISVAMTIPGLLVLFFSFGWILNTIKSQQ
jgi:ABC-type molybdate transport system permease subunit